MNEAMVVKTQSKRGSDDVYHTDPGCRYVRIARTDRTVPLSSVPRLRPCKVCSGKDP